MRMHRLFLMSFILFIFCIAGVSPALSQESLPAIVKKVEPSVVVIITYDEEGEILVQGSGFFTSKDGNVVTNHHVLQGANRAEVKTADGSVYPVKNILAEDEESDLILVSVEIPASAVHPLPVSRSLPERGERIIVIGSPLGLEQTVADGIVSAVREIPAFTSGTFGNTIQITAPISQGSSGSPVVNMKGEVIGVATFLIVEGQNLNFAVPGERVARLSPIKSKTLAEKRAEEIEESKRICLAGINYILAEKYEEALSLFEEIVEKDPRCYPAYMAIGCSNYYLQRYHEAIEAYKKAIGIDPDNVGADSYFMLGWCYDSLGRHQDAIDACKQAIRINPEFSRAYIKMGSIYALMGRFEDAMETFKQAIRINPEFSQAYIMMGSIYALMGRFEDAMETFKQAIRINPDGAEAYWGLGGCYLLLRRHQDAIETLKQAIRIKPDYAEAHLSLGMTYLKVGDRGSALQEYKILKDLDKDLANKLFDFIYE